MRRVEGAAGSSNQSILSFSSNIFIPERLRECLHVAGDEVGETWCEIRLGQAGTHVSST